MAPSSRTRSFAVAGLTSLALAAPLAPAAVAAPVVAAPVVTAPAPQATVGASGKAAVPAAEKRKRSASRSARSYRSSGLLRTAYALRGVPYRWGGSSPWGGFDCSGFTQYVYRVNGMSIPRTTWTQRSRTRWISRRYARPGDLVFFHGRRGVSHVGIYAGGNMIVHSPRPGRSVRTERIWSSAISFGRVG